MKSFISAVILLIAITIFAAGATRYVHDVTSEMMEHIDDIEEGFREGGSTRAASEIALFESNWDKKTPVLCALLYHEYIDEISLSLSRMKVYLKEGVDASFLTECASVRRLLQNIHDSEGLALHNLL